MSVPPGILSLPPLQIHSDTSTLASVVDGVSRHQLAQEASQLDEMLSGR